MSVRPSIGPSLSRALAIFIFLAQVSFRSLSGLSDLTLSDRRSLEYFVLFGSSKSFQEMLIFVTFLKLSRGLGNTYSSSPVFWCSTKTDINGFHVRGSYLQPGVSKYWPLIGQYWPLVGQLVLQSIGTSPDNKSIIFIIMIGILKEELGHFLFTGCNNYLPL